jgi:predicted RNase H-like nuclease
LRAVGADGCRGGWIVAYVDDRCATGVELFGSIAQIAAWRSAESSGAPGLFDVPIGLPARVSLRACDLAARALLGSRRDSVFPVPDRGLLLPTYADVQAEVALRRLTEPHARGLSKQGFGIVPKIAEIDSHLRSDEASRDWIYEMHPEVSFRILAGHDLPSKATKEGEAERLRVLRGVFNDVHSGIADALRRTLRRHVQANDIIDAYVALWTAVRVAEKTSDELGDGGVNAHGLPMRMVI